MSARVPWDYHPDLSKERLITIAKMLVDARNGVVELHEPELGDDPWSLGCRAYAWCRNRIVRAGESSDYPWLTVTDASMHFVFRIGDIPVRFYRGIPDQPNIRTLRRSFDELRQAHFDFGISHTENLIWRYAIETDELGEVDQISVVGFNSADVPECRWLVPLHEITPTLSVVDTSRPDGVELPPPPVRLPLRDVETPSL